MKARKFYVVGLDYKIQTAAGLEMDGSVAPTYWLCDVLRLLDAVDEEKSRVKIEYPAQDHKLYNLMGGPTSSSKKRR